MITEAAHMANDKLIWEPVMTDLMFFFFFKVYDKKSILLKASPKVYGFISTDT